MSITDELREWVTDRFFMANGWQEIHDIADRIDAEHKKAMSRAGQLLADAEKDRDYNYANWQDCKQKVLQGNITFGELNAEIEHLMDELSHRIELPKDADGEYIHVGDVMELVSYDEDYRPVIRTVNAVGEQVFFAWSKENGRYAQYEACAYRHYHAPTVEDVLRQVIACANNGTHVHGALDTEQIVAEYAAKLRLAEGEDA